MPRNLPQAVDGVATVSSERSRAVKMQLDEDRLVLSVNAPDAGAAEEELAVAYGDERLEIGFNAKYLLEIASQVDRENAVFLFNSAGYLTLMRAGTDTSAVYVVMPTAGVISPFGRSLRRGYLNQRKRGSRAFRPHAVAVPVAPAADAGGGRPARGDLGSERRRQDQYP